MRTRSDEWMESQRRRKALDGAAWLAVLMDAHFKGDAGGEAQARRELRRIGVSVTFADEGASHAP